MSCTFDPDLLCDVFIGSRLGRCLCEHACSGGGRVLDEGEGIEGGGAGAAERVCVGCLLPMVGVAVEQGAATVDREEGGVVQ